VLSQQRDGLALVGVGDLREVQQTHVVVEVAADHRRHPFAPARRLGRNETLLDPSEVNLGADHARHLVASMGRSRNIAPDLRRGWRARMFQRLLHGPHLYHPTPASPALCPALSQGGTWATLPGLRFQKEPEPVTCNRTART